MTTTKKPSEIKPRAKYFFADGLTEIASFLSEDLRDEMRVFAERGELKGVVKFEKIDNPGERDEIEYAIEDYGLFLTDDGNVFSRDLYRCGLDDEQITAIAGWLTANKKAIVEALRAEDEIARGIRKYRVVLKQENWFRYTRAYAGLDWDDRGEILCDAIKCCPDVPGRGTNPSLIALSTSAGDVVFFRAPKDRRFEERAGEIVGFCPWEYVDKGRVVRASTKNAHADFVRRNYDEIFKRLAGGPRDVRILHDFD